jgi:NDP-sugar pyrophosphorylase family protein
MPKSLIEIAGKPFIYHQLKLLKQSGFENIVICAGHLGDMIEDYVKDGGDFGLKIDYSFDGDKLLGTGGAVKKAIALLGNSFMVIYGDSYLKVNYKDVEKFFFNSNKDILMTVYKNNGQYDKSNAVFQNGVLKFYSKKGQLKEMNYIDYGLSCFKSDIFSQIQEEVFDLETVYIKGIKQNNIAGYEVFERFYEVGSFDGLKEFSSLQKF